MDLCSSAAPTLMERGKAGQKKRRRKKKNLEEKVAEWEEGVEGFHSKLHLILVHNGTYRPQKHVEVHKKKN